MIEIILKFCNETFEVVAAAEFCLEKWSILIILYSEKIIIVLLGGSDCNGRLQALFSHQFLPLRIQVTFV